MKERDSNFELMRILSMFFIVIYHFFIATGGDLLSHTTGNLHLLVELICMIVMVHVNSFVLITGYFQYNKEFKLKKFIDLYIMFYTYKVVIGTIFLLFTTIPIEKIEILRIYNPIEFDNYWFLKVYLLLYLLTPYINQLINSLDKEKHKKLIITLFILFSVIPLLTNNRTIGNTGFNITHFIYLYIVGAYLNKYKVIKYLKDKYKNIKQYLILIFLSCAGINFFLLGLSNQILLFREKGILVEISKSICTNFYYYETPLLIIQSLAYFIFFGIIKCRSKIINTMSSCIFSVYLITENLLIRDNMYKVLGFDVEYDFIGIKVIIKVFILAVLIMITSIIIELIRKNIMKLISKVKFIKR